MKILSAIKIILFIGLIALVFSCKEVEKNVMDYFPEVTTLSAVKQDDGTVMVTGQILSEGADDIAYAGICFDSTGNPKMNNNQIVAPVSGNLFTVHYQNYDFDVNKRYYFRAWAANEYGYSYGNVIAADSIKAIPVIAPCNPVINTIKTSSTGPVQYVYSVPLPVYTSAGWEVRAQTGNGTFYFIFNEKPKTKIYTNVLNNTPASPNEVHVYFYSGFTIGSIHDGVNVYVNQTGPNNWIITMCDGFYTNGSITPKMTSHFECPL